VLVVLPTPPLLLLRIISTNLASDEMGGLAYKGPWAERKSLVITITAGGRGGGGGGGGCGEYV